MEVFEKTTSNSYLDEGDNGHRICFQLNPTEAPSIWLKVPLRGLYPPYVFHGFKGPYPLSSLRMPPCIFNPWVTTNEMWILILFQFHSEFFNSD